jgi:hypothetical protein
VNTKALTDVFGGLAKSDSKPCRKGDKREKCRKKYKYAFPMLFPSKMGTPRTFRPGTADNGAGGGTPPPAPMPMGDSKSMGPTRLRVMHELKKSMGLLEFFSNHNSSSTPNPAWGGYSVPQLGMVKMRGGGPTIGGPGFENNVDGEDDGAGGIYDLRNSPGLGFRSESAWRVWGAVLDLIDKDPTLPKHSILLRAMAKAGVNPGQIDPAELRLVEMGVEWYLTDPGSLGAKRAGSSLPGGGKTDRGGSLSGAGAP